MDLAELDILALEFASVIDKARADRAEKQADEDRFLAEWSATRAEIEAILNVAKAVACRKGIEAKANKNHGKTISLKVGVKTLVFSPNTDRFVVVIEDGENKPVEHTVEETLRQAKGIVKNFLYSAVGHY